MQANEERALRLGKENVGKLLWQFAVPAVIAMVASSLYNIIDGIFIGHLGPYAIAGVGITAPFMNLSAAFGALIGVGASVLCSIFLGEKNYAKARQTLCNVIVLNFFIGALFTIFGLLFLEPILTFFGASNATLPYAKQYMSIILVTGVFTHIYLGLNSIFRVSGYPNTAMYITLLSVLLNIIFAPLFIFVFDMGVAGAAWATALAQIMCCLIQFYLFLRRDRVVYIEKDKFKPDFDIIRRSLAIGSPNFFTNAAACFVVVLQNYNLLKYGSDLHVGAFTIINRMAFLFVMIILGFSQGMQPIVSYNFGAKNHRRMWDAMFLTMKFGVVISVFGCLVCELFPHAITSLFVSSNDKESLQLIEICVDGFHKNLCSFWMVGFAIICTNFFASIEQPKKALFLSLTRQIIFLIPSLLILSPLIGVDGVWFAAPVADTMATFCAICLIVRERRLQRKYLV